MVRSTSTVTLRNSISSSGPGSLGGSGPFSGIHVLDGAMATELERRRADISGPLWSAQGLDESPSTIAEVHLDYLRAGADCISTASYQVSAHGYGELGQEGAAAERLAEQALCRSVELAEQARAQYAQEMRAGFGSRRRWGPGARRSITGPNTTGATTFLRGPGALSRRAPCGAG